MKNKILLVLNILAILFCISLIFAYFAGIDMVERKHLSKAIAILLTYLIASVRNYINTRKNIKTFQESYKTVLHGVFTDDKKSYKKLMNAIALYADDQYRSARNELKKLLPSCTKRQDYSAVLLFLALCYTEIKDSAHAIESYEKLLEIDVMNSTAWSNLGILYMNENRNDEAMNAYQQALRCDPSDSYAYTNIAALHFRQGNFAQALEYGLKSYEINDQLCETASVIALSSAELGNFEQANKFADLYIKLGGNKKDVMNYIKKRLPAN